MHNNVHRIIAVSPPVDNHHTDLSTPTTPPPPVQPGTLQMVQRIKRAVQ